ncbi:protein of unknown function [Parapedobacter composti]|uniref:DUF4294 domain-containing protein n=1 Tax=Parapedobacter composti TaxID=623281 RepID=A0A1I1GMY8_9SPHI|nr:protein of unknown function [Parapedobacter composti]
MHVLRLLFFLVLLGVAGHVSAQDSLAMRQADQQPRRILVPTMEVNGERIPWLRIPEVQVTRKRVFRSPEDKARYLRLRYNVMKVLPYARYAQNRYEQLHRDLALTDNRREQKRLVKACEKEIKDMFNREIKKLTISQGEILIKLIDRQTGNSSYEVVKDLKGGVTAFFYQSIAKVFGHNLKNTYNPEEDVEIENIIRSLERPGPAYF